MIELNFLLFQGCGNQVFDYCKVINLIHTNEQSEGSKEQAQVNL